MKEFCPACQKEVEYEQVDGDFFCPDCGRNKAAAQQSYKIKRNMERKERISFWACVILTIPAVIFGVWLFRNTAAGERAFYKFALPFFLFFCVGLYYDIKKRNDGKKKKEGTESNEKI